jgi:hypothetical protein
MDYTEQLRWISTLTEKQLTEFLDMAFKARKDSNEMEDIRFFLGHAHRLKFGRKGEPWNLQMACVHDPKKYPDGWQDDAPLCQFGRCEHCKAETVSYAKQGLCMLCGKPVYGT